MTRSALIAAQGNSLAQAAALALLLLTSTASASWRPEKLGSAGGFALSHGAACCCNVTAPSGLILLRGVASDTDAGLRPNVRIAFASSPPTVAGPGGNLGLFIRGESFGQPGRAPLGSRTAIFVLAAWVYDGSEPTLSGTSSIGGPATVCVIYDYGGRGRLPTGTFLSQDPVFGSLENPNSLGTWAYANGNPLRFGDPDGRCAKGWNRNSPSTWRSCKALVDQERAQALTLEPGRGSEAARLATQASRDLSADQDQAFYDRGVTVPIVTAGAALPATPIIAATLGVPTVKAVLGGAGWVVFGFAQTSAQPTAPVLYAPALDSATCAVSEGSGPDRVGACIRAATVVATLGVARVPGGVAFARNNFQFNPAIYAEGTAGANRFMSMVPTLRSTGGIARFLRDPLGFEATFASGLEGAGASLSREMRAPTFTSSPSLPQPLTPAAVAPVPKFADYIFKEGATHGKETVFRGLGYGKEHSTQLAQMWEEQAAAKFARGDYTLGKFDQYGQRINIEIEVPGIGGAVGKTSRMQSGWMIQADGTITLNTPFSGFTR